MEKKYLRDYQPPAYQVEQTILYFKLDADETVVKATYHMKKNTNMDLPLVLDGEAMRLNLLRINGVALPEEDYTVTDKHLTILKQLEALFVLECEVVISPKDNTMLSGLYVSGDCLCTQCEATGFRRIVYSLDRPDVLSTYQVTLEADVSKYPIILANGDCVRTEALPNNRLLKTFVDPSPKPCYLFALVAGEFNERYSSYVSSKGRKHKLYVYLPKVYPGEQADFALQALIKSMQWDEQKYQCHYDLDAYYIVAMASFNFGAMENKGLNIFNTSVLLADPSVTTDEGYLRILSVVGHEYFHNWTGNRVTLRDWFQLSLKEGLTTYREMRFAVDQYGPLARLDYIFDLIERQFPEDKGPTAHPILTDAYVSIDNFYTATTYTKGAEVLRMLEDIVGYEALTRGICAYLTTFDGKAATIDDFLGVLSEQCDFDMEGFKAWYLQKGTPSIDIKTTYDSDKKCLQLSVSQTADLEKNASSYRPKLLPIVGKMYSASGAVLSCDINEGVGEVRENDFVLMMSESDQTWEFSVDEAPVISTFRGLSAPVKHADDLTIEQNAVLIAHDDDPYVRFKKSQDLWIYALKHGFDEKLLAVFDKPMEDVFDHPSLTSLCMRLPSVKFCQEWVGGFEFDDLSEDYNALKKVIGTRWSAQWQKVITYYSQILAHPYTWQSQDIDARRIRGLALGYVMLTDTVDTNCYCLAESIFAQSDNLTDSMYALEALVVRSDYDPSALLNEFYTRSKSHDLLMDKWFYLMAMRAMDDPIGHMQRLMAHKDCDWTRPNRVMACFSGFLSGNFTSLHARDGSGYDWVFDCVNKMDGINPFAATRMVKPLLSLHYYDAHRAKLMRSVLRKLYTSSISAPLKEVVFKGL